MKRLGFLALGLLLASPASQAGDAPITRVWLTHRSNDPSRLVVNWMTEAPGNSVVRYGRDPDTMQEVQIDDSVTLHHVEITLPQRDTAYHYTVSTGLNHSNDATFQSYPTDTLRIAVVADWQGRPDLSSLAKDKPHLLLTAGDNILNLWLACGAGQADCVTPFAHLIDAYPDLFRSTPFLPVLGNHDREIRPRGLKTPALPVYDVEATAFRRFFPLPDDGWKWHFDVPEFDLRLVALDFSHTSDFGTTWQTCHPFDAHSAQSQWYQSLLSDAPSRMVTLYNEQHAIMRRQAAGAWQGLFRLGTCNITGFGHFAERAELDGIVYYNTSLRGKGDRYPDPHSKFLASEDGYLLLTLVRHGPMTVEIKSLSGAVLDRRTWP
jgi:hypothetical protein